MKRFLLATAAMTALLVFASPAVRADGTGSVTVLLNAVGQSLQEELLKSIDPSAVVAVDKIYSLTLTVTEVSFKQYDNSDGKVLNSPANSVVVFSGEQDVDLVTLTGMPEIIAAADIPAGPYSRISMEVENPRLVLKSSLGNVIRRVKISGNGCLFIRQNFEVPADENTIIELTMNSFHLVRKTRGQDKPAQTDASRGGGGGGGGTRYVLNPKLNVSVTVTSADVSLTGEIASVKPNKNKLVLTTAGGDVTVNYSAASIFLPGDTTNPTGTEDDLIPGALADVQGTVDLDGIVAASEIHLK